MRFARCRNAIYWRNPDSRFVSFGSGFAADRETERVQHMNAPSATAAGAGDSDGDNILCSNCQRNQQLKITQLANFVPLNEVTDLVIY